MSHLGKSALEEAKLNAISRLCAKTRKPKAAPKPEARKTEVAPRPAVQQKHAPTQPKDSNYINNLKLNRSYEDYMKSYINGTLPVAQPVQESKLEGVDLFARDEEAERQKALDRERLKRKLQKEQNKYSEKSRKVSATKSVVSADEPVWCARCNRKHEADFHKKEAAKRAAKEPVIVPMKHHRETLERYSEESQSESDLSDFIVSDNEPAHPKISKTIRSMFRYDPSKYVDDEDSSDMEAGVEDILVEEKHSARVARREDEEELRKLMKKHH